jgi:hypothetical protein
MIGVAAGTVKEVYKDEFKTLLSIISKVTKKTTDLPVNLGVLVPGLSTSVIPLGEVYSPSTIPPTTKITKDVIPNLVQINYVPVPSTSPSTSEINVFLSITANPAF